MEGHAKKCVERYCELANKTTQQLYKVSTPCIDDHHFKEEELKSVGDFVKSVLSNCSAKLMTNVVSRCRVRDPTVLASNASENPGNTKSESQKVPLSSLNVQQTGTGKPVMLASSSSSSEWNNDDKWSSQVRKSGEMSKTSTVKLVSNEFVIDIDMDSDTATESDPSLKPRSFLNRVNDRLRKMLNRSPEDSMQDIDKRSMIWRMFMSWTLEASVFMGKNYSDNLHSIKNTGESLTVKQMFEMSEQLILEQSDEIFGVFQISWESSPWKQLSLVTDEEVISLSHAKVYVFSDSVLCLGKMNQNPISNTVWERQLVWFKDSYNTEHWSFLGSGSEKKWYST